MSFLEGKKVLMVMAHPDDEVIFGWPLLQDRSVKKSILVCSSDYYNSERKWCRHRKKALDELCRGLGVEYRCLDYNSEFYRYKTRRLEKENKNYLLKKLTAARKSRNSDEYSEALLSDFIDIVSRNIMEMKFDMIYSHNPWGEYYHIDHILLFNIICSLNKPTIYSDIFIKSNWFPFSDLSENYRKLYLLNRVEDFSINSDFYSSCEKIYRDLSVWTWALPPIEHCSLFRLA